jgi:hypothetical protein
MTSTLIQFVASPLKLHRSDRGFSWVELACVGEPSAVLVQLGEWCPGHRPTVMKPNPVTVGKADDALADEKGGERRTALPRPTTPSQQPLKAEDRVGEDFFGELLGLLLTSGRHEPARQRNASFPTPLDDQTRADPAQQALIGVSHKRFGELLPGWPLPVLTPQGGYYALVTGDSFEVRLQVLRLSLTACSEPLAPRPAPVLRPLTRLPDRRTALGTGLPCWWSREAGPGRSTVLSANTVVLVLDRPPTLTGRETF